MREAAGRWPDWWNAELHGPHRETDVWLLHELHWQLRHLRLLRRTGRRLVTTARDAKLLAKPPALLLAIATDLLAGDDFRSACAELVAALVLAGFETDWSEPVARRIQPAIVAEGWQSLGEGATCATSRGPSLTSFDPRQRSGYSNARTSPRARTIHSSPPPPDASG